MWTVLYWWVQRTVPGLHVPTWNEMLSRSWPPRGSVCRCVWRLQISSDFRCLKLSPFQPPWTHALDVDTEITQEDHFLPTKRICKRVPADTSRWDHLHGKHRCVTSVALKSRQWGIKQVQSCCFSLGEVLAFLYPSTPTPTPALIQLSAHFIIGLIFNPLPDSYVHVAFKILNFHSGAHSLPCHETAICGFRSQLGALSQVYLMSLQVGAICYRMGLHFTSMYLLLWTLISSLCSLRLLSCFPFLIISFFVRNFLLCSWLLWQRDFDQFSLLPTHVARPRSCKGSWYCSWAGY